MLFSGNLIGDEFKEKFRKECLWFYQIAVKYLMENLPHDIRLIKYAQYLHAKKRNESESTNAISNSAVAVVKVCADLIY